jgi:hypothetical protein
MAVNIQHPFFKKKYFRKKISWLYIFNYSFQEGALLFYSGPYGLLYERETLQDPLYNDTRDPYELKSFIIIWTIKY